MEKGLKMKNTKREITNFDEIVDVLSRCDVVRLGIGGGEYPYVVPLSFGFEVLDGRIVLYVHGGREGLKHELLAKDNRVCAEADLFHRYRPTGNSATAEYESVIGFGTAEKAEGADKLHGLRLLMAHCGYPDAPVEKCAASPVTTVYRITLTSVTGKRNL